MPFENLILRYVNLKSISHNILFKHMWLRQHKRTYPWHAVEIKKVHCLLSNYLNKKSFFLVCSIAAKNLKVFIFRRYAWLSDITHTHTLAFPLVYPEHHNSYFCSHPVAVNDHTILVTLLCITELFSTVYVFYSLVMKY